MKPLRLSTLFLIGILGLGSTALGYYYYFVYEPPLAAAESFMRALEQRDLNALKGMILVTMDRDSTQTRAPREDELQRLIVKPFQRGRILDQDKRDGASGHYNFLVYRQPDGSIFALIVKQSAPEEDFKVIIPEHPRDPALPYLWDYTWTN